MVMIIIFFFDKFLEQSMFSENLEPILTQIYLCSQGVLNKDILKSGVAAHAFNPSTWETKTGRSLSSKPAGSKSELQDS